MTKQTQPLERHPWPPFILDNPRVMIMGSFPPQPHRRAMEFYYPNRTNDFWKMTGIIFYNDPTRFYDPTSRQFDLPRIKAFLCERHIAMGDTGTAVVRLRDNASDKFLDIRESIDIFALLDRYPTLTALVTTGEKAAGIIAEKTSTPVPAMGKCETFVHNGRTISHWRMPSTSRAYPLNIEKKADYYRLMFQAAGIYQQPK